VDEPERMAFRIGAKAFDACRAYKPVCSKKTWLKDAFASNHLNDVKK
jgi:hypothetical protein